MPYEELNDILVRKEGEALEFKRAENRFAYEEVVYLLLMGDLPTKTELDAFRHMIADNRPLPEDFFEDMISKAPSKNIMNKMEIKVMAQRI